MNVVCACCPSGVPGLRRSRLAKMACSPCKANKDGMVRVIDDVYSGYKNTILLRRGGALSPTHDVMLRISAVFA